MMDIPTSFWRQWLRHSIWWLKSPVEVKVSELQNHGPSFKLSAEYKAPCLCIRVVIRILPAIETAMPCIWLQFLTWITHTGWGLAKPEDNRSELGPIS